MWVFFICKKSSHTKLHCTCMYSERSYFCALVSLVVSRSEIFLTRKDVSFVSLASSEIEPLQVIYTADKGNSRNIDQIIMICSF